jgi:hypothetical protein
MRGEPLRAETSTSSGNYNFIANVFTSTLQDSRLFDHTDTAIDATYLFFIKVPLGY